MGKKIYLGTMIEDLKTKLDSVMTKLDAQTIALGNINSGVAQSVSELNVYASDTQAAISNNAQYIKTSPVNGTDYNMFNLVSMVNGVIRVKYTLNLAATLSNTNFYIKNGTKVSLGSVVFTSGVDKPLSWDISVNAGDILSFGFTANGTANMTLKANTVVACYDLLDIVNDGGVVYNGM